MLFSDQFLTAWHVMARILAQVEIYSNGEINSIDFVISLLVLFFFCLKPEAGKKQGGFMSHTQVNASCFSIRHLHGI